MKRLVKDSNEVCGLTRLLSEKVLLMCNNYFYHGVLEGVSDGEVELNGVRIVYETGAWSEPGFKDAQELPGELWTVCRGHIESYGRVEKP